MKSHKHLWEQFISQENFNLAAKKAIKSKKSRKSVQWFIKRQDRLVNEARNLVISGKYKTSHYKTFTIYEPKKRIIYNLPLWPDHLVHHALINILGPIWQSLFIRDTYACIPGRGLHSASQKTMEFVRQNKYVLQCDIRKFYPSIDHAKMMEILARKIHDTRILNILNEIVWSVGGDTNLPIGNLTSQWLGNVYMNELDQFVKTKLHWKHYIRYCDDFCLYGNDTHELQQAAQQIEHFINTELKLTFSKCNIRRTSNGVTFIGYRHFKNFLLLRKQTAHKLKRRVLNIIHHHDFSQHAIGQMAAAYGWTKWSCSYNYRKNLALIARKHSRRAGAFISKTFGLK